MANYPDGVLLIGGYLPCCVFNYVMSYVLRYILSHRKVRRGKSFKMILAICCYADDSLCMAHIQPYKSDEGHHQMGKGDAGADNQECVGYYPLCVL